MVQLKTKKGIYTAERSKDQDKWDCMLTKVDGTVIKKTVEARGAMEALCNMRFECALL